MQEGDVVIVENREGEWLIVNVDHPNDPELNCKTDMGRYTILNRDGTEIANSPGYLMSFVRRFDPINEGG